MAENVEPKTVRLAQFLRKASTNEIINWLYKDPLDEEEQAMVPAAWKYLERRVREHPIEARDADGDGDLPIHNVLMLSEGRSRNKAVPLSLVQLLIELHPEGLNIQEETGDIALHFAVRHPCGIDCFRAVLHNSDAEATTTQNDNGMIPLHVSTSPDIALAKMWELICYNYECVTVQEERDGMTTLQLLEREYNQTGRMQNPVRQNAKAVLLKMVANYNHVPPVPSDDMLQMIESHPACTVLAPRLERGNDAFILHQALAAKCPSVLIEALVQVFPNQVQQEYTVGRLPLHIVLQHGLGASVRVLVDSYPAAMFVIDPVTGRSPIEQAILNVGNKKSLGNVDAVNALLRANPAFLSRIE